MIQKFRKKPVVIEAVQFNGNSATIDHFIGGEGVMRRITDGNSVVVAIGILTKEGEMRCDIGDWVIKGVKGEFYPCKPDIFTMTYDLANESDDSKAVELKIPDELVEEKLITMMKEDPVKVLSYLVIQAGRTCQETNAGTLDLSTEATYDGKRYKVSNITTIKEITP
jgi:hypothetical protein